MPAGSGVSTWYVSSLITVQVLGREDPELRDKVLSNLRNVCRGVHGTPVRFYSEIVHTILTTPAFKAKWLKELNAAFTRVKEARQLLYDAILEEKVPGNWDHVINQKGMFCYLNIPEEKVHQLREKYHIYLIFNSRICIAQLNARRVKVFAKALKNVLENP